MKKISCILFVCLVLLLSCYHNDNDQNLEGHSSKVDSLEQKQDAKLATQIQLIPAHVEEEKLSSVFWETEYFNLEISEEYAYCEMMIYDKHLESDSIETTSEVMCSIGTLPFQLTDLSLDSIQVEQARLEFITISQPPLDGFDSAILDELVLQSNWVAYKKKDKIYVPFTNGDPRFIIKEKPELSTAFIVNLLEKSDLEIAPKLEAEFMKTDQKAYWQYCTVIIRITGINNVGKRITKYIVDNELCMQC
jgi:hypothetical protein